MMLEREQLHGHHIHRPLRKPWNRLHHYNSIEINILNPWIISLSLGIKNEIFAIPLQGLF